MDGNEVPQSRQAEVATLDGRTEAGRTEAGAPSESEVRNRRSSIRLIAVGALGVLLLVGALILFRNASTPAQSSVFVPRADSPVVEPSTPTEDVGPNSSFESTVLDTGWTRYESAIEGFSIELPPGWGLLYTTEFGADMRFSASESAPFASYGPSLFVMKNPTNGYSDPEEYFGIWRRYLASTAHVVGDVGMTSTEMRDGQAFILTTAYESKRGEHTETAYGLLDGYTAYRVVFVVSGSYLDDYRDVFNDIAMTFDLSSQL